MPAPFLDCRGWIYPGGCFSSHHLYALRTHALYGAALCMCVAVRSLLRAAFIKTPAHVRYRQRPLSLVAAMRLNWYKLLGHSRCLRAVAAALWIGMYKMMVIGLYSCPRCNVIFPLFASLDTPGTTKFPTKHERVFVDRLALETGPIVAASLIAIV